MLLICTRRDNGLAVATRQPLSGMHIMVNRLVRILGRVLPVFIYTSCTLTAVLYLYQA